MQAHIHVLDASAENPAAMRPQGFLLTAVDAATLTAVGRLGNGPIGPEAESPTGKQGMISHDEVHTAALSCTAQRRPDHHLLMCQCRNCRWTFLTREGMHECMVRFSLSWILTTNVNNFSLFWKGICSPLRVRMR